MPGYDRHYDYGMRGYRETMRAFGPRAFGHPRYDGDMPRHVTARYNLDYVVGTRGDRYPRNFNMYGGDRMQRNGDMRYYRQPYMTRGGSYTLRGSNFPTGYDYPDYGPNYGGRYPDEF